MSQAGAAHRFAEKRAKGGIVTVSERPRSGEIRRFVKNEGNETMGDEGVYAALLKRILERKSVLILRREVKDARRAGRRLLSRFSSTAERPPRSR